MFPDPSAQVGAQFSRTTYMGLIRRGLSIGTVGLVSGSSKKQRVAKATLKQSRAIAKQTAAIAKTGEITAAATAHTAVILTQAQQVAAIQAAEERQFRYDTDPTFREWVDTKRQAEIENQRLQNQQRALEWERHDRLQAAEAQRTAHQQAVRMQRQEKLLSNIGRVFIWLLLIPVVVFVLVPAMLLIWIPQRLISLSRGTRWTGYVGQRELRRAMHALSWQP